MVIQKLVDYIQSTEKQGFSFEQIKNYLLTQNYSEIEILEAYKFINQNNTTNQEIPMPPSTIQGSKIKEFNLHVPSPQETIPQPQNQQNIFDSHSSSPQAPPLPEGTNLQETFGTQKTNHQQISTTKEVTPKKSSNIKHRNPFLIILFSIITFGIYYLYWLISTTKELRKNTKSAPNPNLLWCLLIPAVNFIIIIIYMIKYINAVYEFTKFKKLILYPIWLSPIIPTISILLLPRFISSVEFLESTYSFILGTLALIFSLIFIIVCQVQLNKKSTN